MAVPWRPTNACRLHAVTITGFQGASGGRRVQEMHRSSAEAVGADRRVIECTRSAAAMAVAFDMVMWCTDHGRNAAA
jgi:hypothetical protein